MKKHKRFVPWQNRSARKRGKQRRMRHVEWLEPRAMLAATPLATVTDAVGAAAQTRELNLTLANAAEPVVLTFEARATTGSTFDPAAVRIQNQAGAFLTPLLSQNSINGGLTSRMTIALPNGSYEVHVTGENNTTGSYEVRTFLAGDESGNQLVSEQEFASATASMLQSQFTLNHVAAMVFARQGVDVSQNLFRTEYDVNNSGEVDEFDRDTIAMNVGAPVPSVTLISSQQAPAITVSMTGDTGRSATDGITNNVSATITGSISDDGTITSFTASIDGSTPVELGTLLGQNFATGGNYSLTLAQLEQIAGTGAGSLTNDGTHTLRLTARDAQGNSPNAPVEFTFSFDTVVPAAPTALDLDAASDAGSSNTDNITSVTTPAVSGTTEANAIVQLFSSLATGSIGQATASGTTFNVTGSTLGAGVHNLTATATDVAGNVSVASTALAITIDTTAPAQPTLVLAEGSDTGTVGDNLTTNATVTLNGTTEAGASVTLRRGTTTVASAAADLNGAFQFTNVLLSFGANAFEVVAADLAGVTSTFTRTITRNNAPVVENQAFSFTEESPVGTVVGTVAATDANSVEGDSLRYSITAGNTNNAFVINETTGQIRVANPAAVDFETTPTFALTVTVTDTGGDGTGTAGTGLSDTATVTINLTDANDAPTIANQTFQLAENSANATVVGTVQASDQNAGDTFTYAITGGNASGTFAIDANTGELTVANGAALNFEATPSFALTVTVTDAASLSRSATITVNLQNVNEAPAVADQSFPVPRTSPAGHAIGTITVTDPDAGDTFAFAVIGGNAPEGVFVVNPTTGAITIGNPAGLEADATYTLTVRATDLAGTGLADEATITLNVTPNTAPTAVGDVFQVIQDSTDNGLTVLANDTDPDAGDTLSVSAVGTTESGGTATIPTGGQTIRYTPAPGFLGTDRFNYTVSDGKGGTMQMMVTVQVIAPAPALNAHLHANLSIFINGDQRPNPPSNIGRSLQNQNIAAIHTEAADGRLHIEPSTSGPPTQSVRVDDFFTTWRTNAGSAGNNPNAIFTASQVLDHVVASDEVVRMYVNGLPVAELGSYIIRNEDQIVIAVEKKAAAANAPSFVPIADQTVLAGSPLHIPLEGFDPNSTSITFTAASSNTNVVTTEMAASNRSLVFDVEDFGQMVFELFEDQVSGITQNIISLVQSGILDGTIFHRIIPGFVAQGLDPTGTGGGHPGLFDFDDQYDPDLQHNSSGLLSMAKAGDDTNSSQVFITDINPAVFPNSVSSLRGLDFNHSIFGRLTSGENTRRLIMPVPTSGNPNNRPLTDVVIQDVEIVQIDDRAVLRLKAPQGMTGQADITVTARDAQGNEFTQTFHVTVQPDPFNSAPFLTSTPTNVQTTAGTAVSLPFQSFDVEGDPTMLDAEQVGLDARILFDNTGGETGVTPPGATTFSHLGANFSGGTVTTTGTTPLTASGTSSYVFGQGGGQVTFDVPITVAEFYFVHQAGQTPFTATARDAAGNVLGTVMSSLADEYNDPGNFEVLVSLGPTTPIARIDFSGGHVDNFFFRAQPVPLTFQINQDTDTVTVTPPAGFVGTMAIMVGVQQATLTPPHAGDPVDAQVIRITVLPAGTSSAIAPPDEEEGDFGDDALDAVFDEIGAL
jgi:cyclophilin family peptidyl-prolyl cis-trans isomerase